MTTPLGWILIGYLLGAVCYPAWEVHTAQAEPSAKVKVVTKYQAWNRAHGR